MGRLLRRIGYFITRRRHEEDLAAELEFHRQMKAEELGANAQGRTNLDASVQRALGNDLLARERSRDVWIAPWLQDITQDIRFGARMLAKDRRFTIAAVIALSIGIGINSSVFTIMNTALFRPLPFDEPDRLVDPRLMDAQGRDSYVSYADFLDWSRLTTSFEGLIADQGATMNVSEEGRPAERMRGTFVTANTLRILRVSPFLGRDFADSDDRPGAPGVVIISYQVWQGRYGGEPSVLGRSLRINSTPATIIGVMPPGFTYPMTTQMWQPLSAAPNLDPTNRAIRNLNVVGRLAPGVDLARARIDLETVAAQIAQSHPETNKNLRATLTSLQAARMDSSQARIFLGTLMGAVAFVLLIACANVASLMLARSAQRAREIAIRSSLGASRWRIVRQLLIECALIAVMAGVAGWWISRYVSSVMSVAFEVREIGAPTEGATPYWVDTSVDAVTIIFLGMLLLIVSVAVGLMPSWHLSKTNANDVLKDGGRAGGATVRARRMTGGLLVGQLALTLILLSGAGLLIRAYFAMYFADLVVDTSGVVTMRIVLPVPKYAGVPRQRQFIQQLDERLTALPIFESVSLGSDIPLHPLGFGSRTLAIDGRAWDAGESPSVFFVTVGPRYFETLGLSMLQGRTLTPLDGLTGREGAVVNQRLADRYFPNGDAIGKRIRLTAPNFKPGQAPWFTIVGISPSLPNFFPNRRDEPVVYLPYEADPGPQRAISVIVRASDQNLGKAAAAAALREEVTALDPDLPVFGVLTFDDAVAIARGPQRTVGSWFLAIAVVALTLAAVGLYALTAHGVVQRAHEIGVRMALGARANGVVWIFVRRTVIQLALGLTIGAAGALAIGRLLASFLRDTNPRDPLTLTIAAIVLIVVSLSASVWPARKAARVDPANVLRAE
ncbi:MAG TPA: ABC transporter permease [Vicinamibacterales bacterium]|nr:ABC transporter permease [Vicinamibacterales bacterium]